MFPMIMKIHIHERAGKKIRLWLPMFLIWILLVALLVLLSPVFLLAGIVAGLRGYGKVFLFAFPMLFSVLWAMSGLSIHIEDEDKKVRFIAV